MVSYANDLKQNENAPSEPLVTVDDKIAQVSTASGDERGVPLSSENEDTKFLKGHPVLETGLEVSKYLISARDDGDPAFTFRCIVLGTAFTALSSVITMLYTFKPVQMQVSATFLQQDHSSLNHEINQREVMIFIFGEAWARITPRPDKIKVKWLRGTLRILNFGQPFGIKEHVVASQIASSGNNGLSGIEVYAIERLFYDRSISASTAVLATFSISLKAPISTRSVFKKVFGGASSNEGMGLLNFTLDWQYIQSTYLSLPFKQQINTWAGYFIWYPVMLSLWYGNAWGAKTFPFMSASLFSANGTSFSTTSILTSDNVVDRAKLERVGLPYLTSSTVWGFFSQNLAIGALITHVLIFYGKDMILAWKQARARTQPDPHYQGMLKYKEVPMWWYFVLFGLAFIAGIIVTAKGETTLPVWGYIISLLLGGFIAPFSAILVGLFGNGIATNQISKMVAGAVHPGRPLANLYFASWSHQVILLAVGLANWLKIGQYTKVPHRVMFTTQIYGTLLGAALNYVVMTIIVTNERDVLLDPVGTNVWSGSSLQSMNSQAITWALAKDMYSLQGRYFIVPIGILIGLALPVIHWGVNRWSPRIRKWPINTPIIVFYSGASYFGITSFIWSSITVGVFSQLWLRRRMPHIYNKYNYLIGAALDGGSQIIIFVLSFAVMGASGKEHPFPKWWGNPSGNPDHCMSSSE
ncbi:unnamed protein product [Penicillium salamii]|nr:unnamed protein product [Penicillium salamii]